MRRFCSGLLEALQSARKPMPEVSSRRGKPMQDSRVKTAEIEYPDSDGKPMAETEVHRDWMATSIERLKRYYHGRRVYVSGNLLIYYQEGDPHKSVAPDTFVVKKCKPGRRR